MPSLMAMLGLDASSFQEKLTLSRKHAEQAGKSISSSLSAPIKQALGSFAAGALLRGVADAIGNIKDLSEQFRVSTDTVQRWGKAASNVGLQAEDIGEAFEKLKKARAEAVESGKVGGFGLFGVSLADLRNASISTEKIMDSLAAAAAARPLTDQQDVAGMELMGKSGSKILSAMIELKNLGPINIISQETITALDDAAKRIDEMKRQITVGVAGVGGWWADLWQFIGGQYAGIKALATGRASRSEAHQMAWDWWFSRQAKPASGSQGGPGAFSMTATVDLNKDAKEIERTRLALAEKIFQNQLKALSVEERRLLIKSEIARLEREAIAAEFGEGDDLRAAKERLRAEELRAQLLGLKTGAHARSADVNELQRIGGYSSMDTATRSEQHLGRIASQVQNIEEWLRNRGTSGGVGGFD